MTSHNTQENIKSKAIYLFNQFGTADISIGRIAAEIGISRGNLQYHYTSKQELIRGHLPGYLQGSVKLLGRR